MITDAAPAPDDSHAGRASSAAPLALVIPNDGRFDARAWRIAGIVAGRGRDVELVARAAPGLDSDEVVPGRPSERGVQPGRIRMRRMGGAGGSGRGARGAAISGARSGSAPAPRRASGGRRAIDEVRRIVAVAAAAMAQRRASGPALERAELIHAMGFLALPVALGARAGRWTQLGVRKPIVYDARDIYADARNIARLPRPFRWFFSAVERHWARQADAIVTVNDRLADQLASRFGTKHRPLVVHNCPPRWDPSPDPVDELRAAAGIPAGVPVALYHGGFSRERGLEQLAAAIREPGLETVHAVYLGYGALEPDLRAMAADPAADGRLHVLPAVPPEALLQWLTTADVAVMAIQPTTLNHRLSTPNKLFEAIAAGVPVVASDFVAIRDIVVGDPAGPLGVLCDPTDPAAIARAIRSILEAPPEDRSAMRARCLRAAHEHWNWETQSRPLLELYGRLTGHPW